MSRTVNARISPRLDASAEGVSAWALATDLVPESGADALQSDNARALARKAMRGTRSR